MSKNVGSANYNVIEIAIATTEISGRVMPGGPDKSKSSPYETLTIVTDRKSGSGGRQGSLDCSVCRFPSILINDCKYGMTHTGSNCRGHIEVI